MSHFTTREYKHHTVQNQKNTAFSHEHWSACI